MCRSDAIPNLDWLMLSGNRLANLAVSIWPVSSHAVDAASGTAAAAIMALGVMLLHFWCRALAILGPGTTLHAVCRHSLKCCDANQTVCEIARLQALHKSLCPFVRMLHPVADVKHDVKLTMNTLPTLSTYTHACAAGSGSSQHATQAATP